MKFKTLNDIRKEDAGIESWLESNKIGWLIRDGVVIYYATIDGIMFENGNQFLLACQLYAHSIR
jgi:hypothetical protein